MHDIACKTGFNWQTVSKWLRLLALPDRVAMTPTSRSGVESLVSWTATASQLRCRGSRNVWSIRIYWRQFDPIAEADRPAFFHSRAT